MSPADGRLFWEVETALDVERRPRARCELCPCQTDGKSRAEGGAGFSATPTPHGSVGGAISNGGRFLFLRIN